ncbi:MAG TPA: hypothetical protein VK471_05160 [Solirubrobacterales bacterium]|nr:hypothetical protein [Solirubrobacterales bacterium]
MGEMNSNRRLLLAGVIAAIVVLAVPALALAAVWKDKNGTNVSKFTEFTMNGGEIFETTEGNGMSCEIHATLTTEGGSTGKITKFEVKKCTASFGSFATTKCELNVGEGKGLPWTVDVNATDLTVTNWRTKHTFKGASCKEAELDKTIASMTVTLEPSTTEVSELAFIGIILSEGKQAYRTFGSLEIEGANKGTYGIG